MLHSSVDAAGPRRDAGCAASVSGHVAADFPRRPRLSRRADRRVLRVYPLLFMRPLDWVVLCGTLAFIVSYGLYKGRGSDTMKKYLLAGKTMPWYAMALSIMATQASAVTFISTTGQAYVAGIRFVQFYFGVPVAMVILSATAVPLFPRAHASPPPEYISKPFPRYT